MRVLLNCKYCGYKWEEQIYSENSLREKRCIRCKDKNLSYKDLKDQYVDTYIGCPPFPDPEREEDKPDPYEEGFGADFAYWNTNKGYN